MDLSPLILTFKLATVTTLVLIVISIPIAYKLAFSKSKIKPFFEAVVTLPMVLPPTVLGFYLLVAFSPNTGIGYWLNQTFGLQLVFSFPGLVVASVIYSLPFMVQPFQSGMQLVPKSLVEGSMVLGKTKWQRLRFVILPNIKPSLLTGIVLAFAHTVGEFGVVLMIGGNIPGVTKVASIAIYDEVEGMNYSAANQYSLVLVVLSLIILFGVYYYSTSQKQATQK
ncbi:MAG: molybdate ABC transporter permease subunit [Salibacteraceae bacterium]